MIEKGLQSSEEDGRWPPRQNQTWNSVLLTILILHIVHAYLLKHKHPGIENKMLECQDLHLYLILAAKDKEKNKEKKFKEFVRVKPKKKKKKKKKTKPGKFSPGVFHLDFLTVGREGLLLPSLGLWGEEGPAGL